MRLITDRARKRLSLAALAAVVLLAGTGCSSLLDVEIPGRVPADELDNPALASIMVASALGEFECALGSFVATTGILSSEYIISGVTIGANIWGWRGEVELRATEGDCATGRGGGGYGYYTPLQRARYMAEDAGKRIEAFPDAEVAGKPLLLATLKAYEGYALTLLGEGFCQMAINEGPLMTPAQVFAIAEERFSQAITLAGTTPAANADIRNMALVGRARARLNLGKKPEAAADAELVPENYLRNAVYSSVKPRRENRVHNVTILSFDLSVSPAYRNLMVGTVADSRVQTQFINRNGGDGVTPQWNQRKYTLPTSPIPIASWDEAQLIIAEARGGAAAVTAINRLRTKAALPLIPAGTVLTQADIIEERRRELFSEGHRYYDMLRNSIPLPQGTNHKGQTYGIKDCLPLPDVERLNNPQITN
jgi:hypothetical protein